MALQVFKIKKTSSSSWYVLPTPVTLKPAVNALDNSKSGRDNNTGKVIGAEQGRSWRAVEGQIRTAAKTAWRTNSQSLANMAGYPLPKPPTPSEFIAILHYYTKEKYISAPTPHLTTGER